MDNKLEQLQEEYRNVPIPDELDFVVHKALKAKKKRKVSSKWLTGASAAAMVFIIGINSSATVANAFSVIPGVDSIVKVLTFREYAVNESTYNADIKVPVITNLDNKELELGLNQKYLAENKKLFDEFQADMETMKKEGDGHLGIDTGFEVKTDNDSILSIGRYVVNTVGSSSTTMKYDTIDKKNQILLNLPMLFKDDQYISVISENISNQMIAQMKADPDKVYWIATEENKDPLYDFKNIKKDQSFYINNSGQLVITFDKYDVAPGYMGLAEFVIPTEVISDILVSHNLIK
ncbi:anti-sigma factor [Paenibacillus macquariensis subsp. defensor]|nr:anti-sigma factor [Paenibacillus macquariensis subsp. defensor]